MGEVAKALMLDSGTTTPLVRRLETRGLLQRTRSTTDERVVSVTLTEEGRALEAEMVNLTSDVGTATGLGVDDAQLTIATLQNINQNLVDAIAAASKDNAQNPS